MWILIDQINTCCEIITEIPVNICRISQIKSFKVITDKIQSIIDENIHSCDNNSNEWAINDSIVYSVFFYWHCKLFLVNIHTMSLEVSISNWTQIAIDRYLKPQIVQITIQSNRSQTV